MHPCSPLLRRLTFAAVLCLAVPASAAEGEGAPGQPADSAPEIGVCVEHIELDRATASKLVREFDGDGTALRRHLQTLIGEGKAEMRDSGYLLVRAWGRARLTSVDEFLYPTEYEPPVKPQRITGKVAPGVDLEIPSNPTAFDSRDVGNTLEVGADVMPGEKLISLNVYSALVEYTGDTVYGDGKVIAAQPKFDVLQCQSNVVVRSGRYALLAVQVPRAPGEKPDQVRRDASRRILVMVRATILDRGGAAPQKP